KPASCAATIDRSSSVIPPTRTRAFALALGWRRDPTPAASTTSRDVCILIDLLLAVAPSEPPGLLHCGTGSPNPRAVGRLPLRRGCHGLTGTAGGPRPILPGVSGRVSTVGDARSYRGTWRAGSRAASTRTPVHAGRGVP